MSDEPEKPKRVRTWPAALALLFLSPSVGEMISGSTPPLLFVQPFALIFLPAMYGAWALLTHEVIARRRLGWGNALLLGAAFGVFQEALVVQTWFNSISPQSPSHMGGEYGLVAGTSLNWALNLTNCISLVDVSPSAKRPRSGNRMARSARAGMWPGSYTTTTVFSAMSALRFSA